MYLQVPNVRQWFSLQHRIVFLYLHSPPVQLSLSSHPNKERVFNAQTQSLCFIAHLRLKQDDSYHYEIRFRVAQQLKKIG